MNPWIIVGFLVALIAVGGVGYRTGNTNGHTAEKAVWVERENKELTDANATITRLEESARLTEKQHTSDLAYIAEKYEKEKADGNKQKQSDGAAVRGGTLGLRIPPAACKDAGAGDVPGIAGAAGERDGGATTELPREVTANLFDLVNDADEVVKQLSACQAVVEADRKELEKRDVR